jgi:hypothetical protein
LNIEVKDETINRLKETLSDEQIVALVNQQLEAYALLQGGLTDKIVYNQFNNYLNKRRKALESYPTTARDAMLGTLNEFSLTNKTALIRKVGACFNAKLQVLDKNIKPFSQKSVGNLLSALGFDKRVGVSQTLKVVIDTDLLHQYNTRREKRGITNDCHIA